MSAQPNVITRWVHVTPELASQWLDQNPRNRNLRERIVAKYASDMLAGAWSEDAGDPIRRTADGILLDGQHRLSAIVRTGVAIWMLVVEGVKPASQANMDTGSARLYADQLRIQGRRNVNVHAALLRWSVLWERGMRVANYGATPPTHSQMLEMQSEHPELEESADFAVKAARLLRIPASVFAMAHWLFSRIDKAEAEWFLSRVADGTELAADHPAYAFRERTRRDRENQRKVPIHVHLALLIMAWNAYRDGRSLTKLQLPSAGLNQGN